MSIYKRCDRCQKDVTDKESVEIKAIIKRPPKWTRDFFPFATVRKEYCLDCFFKYIINDLKVDMRNIKEGVKV